MKPKIILLAGSGISTNIMYHSLQSDYDIDIVILENPVPKSRLIKGRIKRLGYIKVAGQIMFLAICSPFLKSISSKRRKEILNQFSMDISPIPADKIIHVSSVNSQKCRKQIKKINPAVVVVNGTRIISKKVLNTTTGTFLNTHAGITPKYRGVHGGYWALAQDDKAHCGVTVHLIDEGIDTGSVLYQDTIDPSRNDNFTTYPLLQLGTGIPLMKKAIGDVLRGDPQPVDPLVKESHLWYHPTIWFYLSTLMTKGVK